MPDQEKDMMQGGFFHKIDALVIDVKSAVLTMDETIAETHNKEKALCQLFDDIIVLMHHYNVANAEFYNEEAWR